MTTHAPGPGLGPIADTGEFGGNPPMLLKLRDGRLCLTYGYRTQPYGIRARFSRRWQTLGRHRHHPRWRLYVGGRLPAQRATFRR